MDIDQDFQEQTIPQGTPFDDSYTTTTIRGAPYADSPIGVKTEKYYTPLYTESQETGHTNVNTRQQSPQPMRTRLEAIWNAELAATVAAAAAKAKASAEAAVVEAEANKKAVGEAEAATAAKTAAKAEAIAKATTSANATTTTTSAEAEAAAATAMADASVAKAAATTPKGTAATEAKHPNNNTQPGTAHQTRAVPPS